MTLTDRINGMLRRVPPWTIYVIGVGWALWLFYLGATGGLGVEPIEALEHAYGELALQLIIAGLCVTPMCRHLRINVMRFRRAIGVTAFFYVFVHFLVWAVLDVGNVSAIWADIVKRPYVTIGMAGFALLIPLAITSNDLSVRRMGAVAWRKLHKLVYPAAFLGAVHFVWLAKGFQLEPLIYLTIILGLLALRMKPNRMRVARPTR